MLASRAFLTVRVTLVLRSGEIAVRSPGGDRGGPSQREPDPARDHLDGRVVARARGGARAPSSACSRRRARSTPASSTSSRTAAAGSSCGRRREPYGHLVGHIALERGEGLAWWAAEQQRAGVHPRQRALRPALQVRRRSSTRRSSSRSSRCRSSGRDGAGDRSRLAAHRGAARVHRGRGRVPRLERVAHGGRDRERPPLRGDAAAGRRAGAAHGARRGDRPRRDARRAAAGGRRRVRRAPAAAGLPSLPARLRRARSSACARRLRRAPRRARRSTLAGSGRRSRAAAGTPRSPSPLVAGDELLGLLLGEGTTAVDLARAVASQTAVAIKKIELIERLTEKNLIKDFFEQLAGGASLGDVEGRAARLGCDLDQPLPRARGRPADDALEKALAARAPRLALRPARRFDAGAAARSAGRRAERLLETLRRRPAPSSSARSAIGVSNVCQGAASFAAGFEEARHALLGTSVLQASRASWPTTSSARTSTSCGCRSTRRARLAPRRGRAAGRVRPRSARPRCCRRSRSSCAAAATSAPPPRRCTSTRTRCASGCGGSWRSRASTCAGTTG